MTTQFIDHTALFLAMRENLNRAEWIPPRRILHRADQVNRRVEKMLNSPLHDLARDGDLEIHDDNGIPHDDKRVDAMDGKPQVPFTGEYK